MVYELRIVLYQNKENRGSLYTKVKGILLAKGKYITVLDEDNIFAQRDAFSTLYKEAEKNNLDILCFGMLMTKIKINIIRANSTNPEPSIIYQPELGRKMFQFTKSGEIVQEGGTLLNNFKKKSILLMDCDINEPAVKFKTSEKYKVRANEKCFGYFNFMEFILNKTENAYYEKN